MFPLQVVSLTVTFPPTFKSPGPLIWLMLDAGMFSVSVTFKCCVSVSVWLSAIAIFTSSIVPLKSALSAPPYGFAKTNNSVWFAPAIAPAPVSVAATWKSFASTTLPAPVWFRFKL